MVDILINVGWFLLAGLIGVVGLVSLAFIVAVFLDIVSILRGP